MEKNESTCGEMTEGQKHSMSVMDEHIRDVKTCRKMMDEVIQKMRTCRAGFSSQLDTAIMNAQQAQMWCGMELKRCKEMGYGDDPYPNSKDPSNTIIEPTADGLKM